MRDFGTNGKHRGSIVTTLGCWLWVWAVILLCWPNTIVCASAPVTFSPVTFPSAISPWISGPVLPSELLVSVSTAPVVVQQDVEGVPPVEQKAPPQDDKPAKSDENAEPFVEAAKVASKPLGPRQIRLHLWDGSIVMGDVSIDSIHVETRFGKLEVPIANILEFRPGLSSVPAIDQQIVAYVEKLGDREFQVRESARQSLAAMGPMIRNRLRQFADEGSAERKKHLATLLDEFAQQVEDGSEDGESIEPPIEIEDTITTGEFTIVGKIVEKQYQLSTQYGQLNLDLQHIKRADRVWNRTESGVRKTVDVAGDQFFQKTPLSTRILVKAGDRVSIRASGSVAWVSWGNVSSGPDGTNQQGEWNGAQCGTLMARVGKSGEYIKIGSKGDFVAKSGGELFLGIAMQDHLATQEGYQWGGKYRAKIVVESSGDNP